MRLEKDTIMKNSCYILILSGLLLLAGSCSQEDLMPTGNDAQQGEPTGNGKITLSFKLAENAGTATRANDGMEEEEGNIKTLDYAIFQGKRCVRYERILRDELTVHSTGDDGVKNIYTLKNVEEEWFDETTEIFAVVNAPEEMHNALFTSDPAPVAADNATLLSILDDYIKEKARIDTYDDLIKAQYSGTECPVDGYLYYKPINSNNRIKLEQKYKLEADQTFSNYAELISKKQSASGDALVMYNKFIEDIECRFKLFRTLDYNKHLAERQAQEDELAQELSQNKDFLRYILWRDYVHTEDLNQTAAESENRQLDNPLMSGYLALGNNIGSIITVPVEHAYCRICFQCSFTGVIDSVFNKEHKYIDFKSIQVAKLPNKTKLFNISSVNSENNPSDGELNRTAQIAASAAEASDKQAPFFGDLTKNPSHWGNDWQSNFRYYPEHATYSTVCRYPLKSNSKEFDTSNAKRYYIYAYQWGGTSTDADPKITLTYGFREPEQSEITHKELGAYLYDDTHSDAKLHHGLLRNYTYIVNCHLNANTSKLELQVTSHDWYTHTVTDIPAFE